MTWTGYLWIQQIQAFLGLAIYIPLIITLHLAGIPIIEYGYKMNNISTHLLSFIFGVTIAVFSLMAYRFFTRFHIATGKEVQVMQFMVAEAEKIYGKEDLKCLIESNHIEVFVGN